MKPTKKILLGDEQKAKGYLGWAEKILAGMQKRQDENPDVYVPPVRRTVGKNVLIIVQLLPAVNRIIIQAREGGYDLIFRDVQTVEGTWKLQYYGFNLKKKVKVKLFTIDLAALSKEAFISGNWSYNGLPPFYGGGSTFTLVVGRDLFVDSEEALYPHEILVTAFPGGRPSKGTPKRYTIAPEGAPANYMEDRKWLRGYTTYIPNELSPTNLLQASLTKRTQDGQEVAIADYLSVYTGQLLHKHGASIIQKAKSSDEDFVHKYRFPITDAEMINTFPLAVGQLVNQSTLEPYASYNFFQSGQLQMVGSNQYGAFFEGGHLSLTAARNFQVNSNQQFYYGYQEIWRITYDGAAPTRELNWVQYSNGSQFQVITDFFTDYLREESGFVMKKQIDAAGFQDDLVVVYSAPYTRIAGYTARFFFYIGDLMGYGYREANYPSGDSPYWVECWKFGENAFAMYYSNSDGGACYNLYKDAIITWTDGVFKVIYSPATTRSIYSCKHNHLSPTVCVLYEADRPAPNAPFGQRLNAKVLLLDVITGKTVIVEEGATAQPLAHVQPTGPIKL